MQEGSFSSSSTSESLRSLNVGCGSDVFGDVRLDLSSSYLSKKHSKPPDILADAHHLPLRDASFAYVRSSHVIEHLANPELFLHELARVCTRTIELMFPVDDGFKRPILFWATSASWRSLRTVLRTRASRSHLWVVNPQYVVKKLKAFGFEVRVEEPIRYLFQFFPFLSSGGKSKILRFLTRPLKVRYEYHLIATKIKV